MSTVRIQIRRGLADQWASVNPVLAAGEIGLESDTNYIKFGDGTSEWADLEYANEPLSALQDTLTDYILITDRNSAGGVAALDAQGNLLVPKDRIIIEGTTANDFETSVVAIDPTADRILNLPDANGTLATQEYVTTQFQNLVDGAPTALNTLNELAAAIGDNENYASTIVTALDAKAPNSSPTFSGTVVLPTTTSIGTVSSTEISYLDGVTGIIQDQFDGLNTRVNSTETAVLKIADVNKTQIDYLIGTTSNIQTQITDGLSNLSDDLSGQISDLDTALNSSINLKAPLISPTFTGTVTLPLGTSIGDVSNTELQYLNGVTSAVQTQLDAKATSSNLSSHTGASTNVHGISDTAALATKTYVDNADALKANLAAPTFTGTVVLPSTTSIGNVSSTELGYVDGVTSAIQTQIDAKAPLASPTFTGTVTLPANTITQSMMSDDSVGTNEIVGLAITTEKIANSAVTSAKIANDTIVDADINSAAAIAQSKISGLSTSFGLKADLASPALTGTPTAPTAAVATSTTQIATTAYVRGEISALVNSATSTLDTLGEIATALGNDANLSTTLTNSIALKAPLNSPTFTGTVTLPSGTVTSTMILDGTIVDADINASAAIATSKISGLDTALSAKLASATAATTYATIANPTFTGTNTVANITVSGTSNMSANGVQFSDGTQTKEGVVSRTPIIQKTASYTLTATTERDSMIEVASGSGTTITIPTNTAVAFPVGTSIDILQTSTGQVTIAGDAGVTVNATPGLKLRTQWSSCTLFKRAINTWVVYGDLSA
jgi:hypothetical protein